MITILTAGTPAELHYTLYPFLRYSGPAPARIVDHIENVKPETKAVVVLKKWLKIHAPEQRARVLSQLRDSFSRVVYLDDSDSPHSGQYDLIEYFDLFYQKQLLRDRTLYTRTFIGNRYFCDFYARRNGIENDTDEIYPVVEATEHLQKLRVCWNLGAGQYPLLPGVVQKIASKIIQPVVGYRGHRVVLSRPQFRSFDLLTDPVCHARFSPGGYRPLVGYQRQLFLQCVGDDPLFLTGRVPRREYDRELRSVQAVLSPFGWGEVCYRDFESVIGGNVLVKPDMSHIETWPDIYRNDESYVPVAWDGSDLLERVSDLLDHTERMRAISRSAQDRYQRALDSLDQRVDEFVAEVSGEHGPA
jgi:hypothetical protein